MKMKYLLIPILGFLAGCQEAVYFGSEIPTYREFLGYHLDTCENGTASGFYIEKEDNVNKLNTFNAQFTDCESYIVESIEYEYLYDFTITATGRDMERTGRANIIYFVDVETEELSTIYMRNNGFVTNEKFYEKIYIVDQVLGEG